MSGGSAGIPASWCGVVGLKLTYGALPYHGYNGANSTFSAPGVLAREVADARLLLEALLARPLATDDLADVHIGVVRQPFWDNLDARRRHRRAADDRLGPRRPARPG